MAVSNNPAVNLTGLQIRISAQEFGDLRFYGMGKQRMRSIVQNIDE